MQPLQPAYITVDSSAWPGSPTAGIQEAIDALPATGGVIHIPSGEYIVRHSIKPGDNVTLLGEGCATVLRRPPTLVFDIVEKTPDQQVAAELSDTTGLLCGDEIYLCDSTQGGWHARHVTVTAIRGNQIEGELVAGDPTRRYGPTSGGQCGNFFPLIFIQRAGDVTIADLLIDGGPHPVTAESMPGFTCSAVHGSHATNLHVRNVTVRNWPCDGISAQNGTATVTHCTAEGCVGHGYHPGSGIGRSIWANNFGHRNSGDGFFFCRGVRNAVVSGNVFSENAGNGIGNLTDPDAFNVVSGNVIFGNGQHGIEGFAALGNVIADNLIRDNSTAQPGKFAAIYLECYRDNSVTGNVCLSTQSPATQSRGIELIEPSGENVVAHNKGTVTQIDTVLQPPPQAAVQYTDPTPAVDGNVQSAPWQQADPIILNKRVEDGSPLEVTATTRILHNDKYLFIGVTCNEPLMERIKSDVTEDGGPVWSDDCIEIYLQPNPAEKACIHFAINSNGALFERICDGPSHKEWQSKARAAAIRSDDSWSMTLAIPLDCLPGEAIQPGGQFKMNIYRTRLAVTPPERSCWAPTRASFLMPARFATLTLAEKARD